MKLHWSPRSPFVRKVMIVAHERGLLGRLQCVRTVAAMTTPHAALMRDNPLSKIPTLVLDDGMALYDSPVICEYLDALAGTSEVEAVVAAVSRTGVKAHPAQGLGELRIFLTAIGTNHNNACIGYLRNAIIAHCGSPVIHPRAGFRARRIANILANDCFNIALSGQFPGGSRLSVFDRRGSITITMGAIRSRPRDHAQGNG